MSKWKKFYENILYIQDYMGLRKIAAIAAATAFWFFLSIVPIVILAVSILPYTPLTEQELLQFIAPVVPDSVFDLITIIVADVYRSSPAILSVSIVATVWSAARGFSSLIRGLEEIYQHSHPTGYLVRRLRGILYTLAMLIFMLISIALGGFGQQLAHVVESLFPAAHTFVLFLLHFRFLVVIAALTLFFTAIFHWGSGIRLPLAQTWPGALLSALGWSALTWIFSKWVSGSYGTYGSLATVVIVMLWLYYGQYLLLLGACFNRALPSALPRIEKLRKAKNSAEE